MCANGCTSCEDAPRWRTLREEALADERLTAFLVDNLARVMLQHCRGGRIVDHGADEHGPFERARAELVRFGAASVPTLTELLAIGDALTAHQCAELLAEIGAAAIDSVVSLLERDDDQARARAAELLARLPHARAGEGRVRAALAEVLAGDSFWLARSRAAGALGARGARDTDLTATRKMLLPGLADEDTTVARETAVALARLGDPEAIPALINFLEGTEDLPCHRAAQGALEILARTREPQSARAWRAWWRDNRPAPSQSR